MRLVSPAVLLAVLLSSCITVPIEERAVFEDRRTVTPADFDLARMTLETVRIPVGEGLSLDAWWVAHEADRATVLYFGGQGFLMVHARSQLELFSEMGVNVLLVDYRGYGLSDGEPSVAALRADAEAVYAWLREQRGVRPERLVVHGHSMGSFVAAGVADTQPVAALVLESPVTTVAGLTRAFVPRPLRWLVRFDIDDVLAAENNLERVARVPAPTLVLVGTDDRVTPPSLARELYDASAAADRRLVEASGRGHNDLPDDPAVRRAYDAMLQSVERGSSPGG